MYYHGILGKHVIFFFNVLMAVPRTATKRSSMPDKTEEKKPRLGNTPMWKKILFNRWLLIGIGALLIYSLIGFFLAPRLVRHFVTDFGQKTLKRQTSIGEVRVNPFIFTLDANDFSLAEEDGRPVVGFKRFFVDFDLSSLFRWAWTFADIRLEKPFLLAEIESDGRLNFAKIAESIPKSESPPPDEKGSQPPRLVIEHAQIFDGAFTFSDQSGATPAEETFTPIHLEFKEISTLPERKGPYTIQAELPGGGKVSWEGEVSLHPLFSEGRLRMSGLKLATAWEFAQDKLRLAEPEGEINADTTYRFNYLEHTPLLVLEDGNYELKGLKLVEKGRTEPAVAIKDIGGSGVGFDLKNRLVTIPEILLSNGKIMASVSKNGVLDLQTMVVSEKMPKHGARTLKQQTADDSPWEVNAEAVKVEDVAVDFKDSSRANPLKLAVGGLNLSLNAAAVVGRGEPRATINKLQIGLNKVTVLSEDEDEPLVKFDSLGLNDGKVDVGNRSIELDRIEIRGGESRMVRDHEGRLRLVEAFAPADRGMVRRKISEIGQEARDQERPWSFRLESFALDNFKTLLEDHTFSSPVEYTFQDVRATFNQIANDAKTPVQFDTEIKIAQGGEVKISGQAGISGDDAEANIEISGFNLTPLQPAIAQFSTFVLTSGNVSATAKVKYQMKDSSPQVRVDADVSVDRFKLNEAATNERALEWNNLSASGINFSLSPDRLDIKKVRLLEPGAKILISKDRRLNLAEAIKTPTAEKAQRSPPPPPSAKGKKQSVLPVDIAAVRVEKGTVDFSDLSLVLPFATRITDFKGGLSDISSADNSRSAVKFDGRVGQYGLADVEGSLLPFSPKDFTDIRVKIQNVEMQTLSPYSATFAGRKIASGVLNLDLGYKIQDGKLLGDNRVVLERFT